MERVVAEAGADLRDAAFFFGERLKGLRRAGVAVDHVPADAWVELFRAFAARPARREAWHILARRMAERVGESVSGLLGELGLDHEPPGWRAMLPRWFEKAEAEAYDDDPGRVLRHATGRGHGDAAGPRAREQRRPGGAGRGGGEAVSAPDPLKGYKGRARARLALFGVRVWSDVRAVNDAGSVFEGVILPRSETFDDLHVVIKLKTGYNVGLHVDRVGA